MTDTLGHLLAVQDLDTATELENSFGTFGVMASSEGVNTGRAGKAMEASNISRGGSSATDRGLPVSSRLFRLDSTAGQPDRPPDRIASGTFHEWDSVMMSRTASPACAIS